jgi:hypothetical protein
MEITLTAKIPDDTAAKLQNGSTIPLPRRLLELAVIKAFEAALITEREAMNALGLADGAALAACFQQFTPQDQHTMSDIVRRQQAILNQMESDAWPEEPDVPEAPTANSVNEFLL